MVLLNEVISTKIMIELVIFEILPFVESTKNTAGYRTSVTYLVLQKATLATSTKLQEL